MKNISLITSINLVKSDVLTPLKYIQQSASLAVSQSNTKQGLSKLYTLSFKIAGISPNNNSVCSAIMRADSIITTDAHGIKTHIGTKALRHTTKTDTITDGRAGSFRGYVVTIEWHTV